MSPGPIPEMTHADWARFWGSTTPDGECLIWRPQSGGKPKFYVKNTSYTPSIIAFTDAGGEIPEGWYLTRTCRKKRCVTPGHAMPHHATKIEPTDEQYREHFWSKVERTGPVPSHAPQLGECWLWTEGLFSTGYGQFWYRGLSRGAHRMAYVFENGQPGDGLVVDHMCFERLCVRPGHLRAVKQWENLQNLGPHVSTGKSGYRGVSRGNYGGYRAAATIQGKVHYLGTFPTAEEAHEVVSAFRRVNAPASMLDQEREVAA